jgi:hypothetical protein
MTAKELWVEARADLDEATEDYRKGAITWAQLNFVRQAEYAAWYEYAHDHQPVVPMNPGLVITSGLFTKEAVEESKDPHKVPIGLVNGNKFVELLLEHEVGVQHVNVTLYRLKLDDLSKNSLNLSLRKLRRPTSDHFFQRWSLDFVSDALGDGRAATMGDDSEQSRPCTPGARRARERHRTSARSVTAYDAALAVFIETGREHYIQVCQANKNMGFTAAQEMPSPSKWQHNAASLWLMTSAKYVASINKNARLVPPWKLSGRPSDGAGKIYLTASLPIGGGVFTHPAFRCSERA